MPLLRPFRRLLAPAALLLFVARPAWTQVSARDSVYLITTTQALLDAITDGDSAHWAQHLAPDWFLSDEEGQHLTRTAFLTGLHPLPPGQEGKLTVANVHLVGAPGVAVISYDAEEEHHFYGQLLLTTFHMTDTYVRRRGRWWQIAAQATALPRPLAGRPVAPVLLREYAGTYELTSDIHLTVAVTDSGLAIVRPGRGPQPLYALDDRLFIRHGVRGFWVFEHDSTGAVADLVNWRDNNAVVWHRQH